MSLTLRIISIACGSGLLDVAVPQCPYDSAACVQCNEKTVKDAEDLQNWLTAFFTIDKQHKAVLMPSPYLNTLLLIF